MNIAKEKLIQEIDGISPDDVVIIEVQTIGNHMKIRWMEWSDDAQSLLECEHIIKNFGNKPSGQEDIIIVNERKV